MDHNMVLSFYFSNRNRRRRQTNAHPSRAISMAMAVRRWNTAHIDQWRRSREFIKATKCRHWAINRYVLPRRPPGWQQTKQLCKIPPPFAGHFYECGGAPVLYHAHCLMEVVRRFSKSLSTPPSGKHLLRNCPIGHAYPWIWTYISSSNQQKWARVDILARISIGGRHIKLTGTT